MASFKTLAALALLSVTTSTLAYSTTLQRQPGYNEFRQELSEPELAAIPGASTTIRRTSSIVLNSDRSQCAATAAGGLGQCEPNPFRCAFAVPRLVVSQIEPLK